MKIDRLMGILTVLLQKDKVTAPELAERFEVSRRTILRDIDALCQAGIPVVTVQGGNGGISIMDGYKINKSVLTVEELQDLTAALRGLDSVSETSGLERLMMKLAPENDAVLSLSDSIVIDLASHYKDSLSEKIALLKQAIHEKRVISFDYYSAGGESRRTVEPVVIEFRWQSWYVFGWCRGREDFRRFKLNRLWNLTVTDQIYRPRPVPEEKASVADTFPIRHRMEVLFDKLMRFRLIEEYGPDCYEERPDGLLFLLDYTNKEYTYSWLLGFGDMAEILSPPDTREEFKACVRRLTEKYDI